MTPKPTTSDLAAIQRELLAVELELKPIDCFPAIHSQDDFFAQLLADTYRMDGELTATRAVLDERSEDLAALRKQVHELRGWVIVLALLAAGLFVAVIVAIGSGM